MVGEWRANNNNNNMRNGRMDRLKSKFRGIVDCFFQHFSLDLGQILKSGSTTAFKRLENYRLTTTSGKNLSNNNNAKDAGVSQLYVRRSFANH